MSERSKVILYTLVASVLLFLGVAKFMSGTEEYASRLDIRSTSRDPAWDPENEIVNERAPVNPTSVVRAEVDPNASVQGNPAAPSSASTGNDVDEEDLRERDEDEERLTVADVERPDSDGEMESSVVVAGMSPEEAALVERIDPELLTGRPTTRALDLMLSECVVAIPDTGPGGAAEAPNVAGSDAGGSGRGAVDNSDPGDVQSNDAGQDKVLRRQDVLIGVRFRHASVAIKGSSLNRVDAMINLFNTCDSALLVVAHNPEGRVDIDDDEEFLVRREDELKYYLLQRRVPAEFLRFPERS